MTRMLYILFLCTAFVLVAPATKAQEDSTLQSMSLRDLLNVKITTAGKISQSSELASAVVTVITKEQIRSRGYQSLLDVMYDLADIKVDDKMYSGMRNSFTVRGTQGFEKFIILLDGVSISSPSGEAMPIMENYPVHLAEQVEVLYGPASALYGANAVSCVINIITKKTPSRKNVQLDVTSVGGSYGYSNTTLYLSKRLTDEMNLVIGGQYSHDRGADHSKIYKNDPLLSIESYKTGVFNTIFGPMTPAAPLRPKYEAPMKAHNVYIGLHSNRFHASFFRNYFNIPTSFGNNTSNALYNKEVYMAQSINTFNTSYRVPMNKMAATTLFTVSSYYLDPKSNYRNLYSGMEPAYKYSYNTMLRVEEQFEYKQSPGLNFTGGLSLEHYDALPQSGDLQEPVDPRDYISRAYLGTKTFYRPEGIPAQFFHIRYHNLGAYLQTQWQPHEAVNVTLGARYDKNSRYGNTFNPRVGVVYKPAEKTTIKALYGSAFLAPTTSDSYVHYGSFITEDSGKTFRSYFLHLPNPHLKPITSNNFEVNLRQYITDNISFSLSGYYTVLDGMHEFADDNESTKLYNNMFNGIPVDYVEVFVNEGKQKNYGAALQLNWKHNIGDITFNTYGSLSFIDGLLIDPVVTGQERARSELDFISHYMFHLGTDMRAGKFSFSPRLIALSEQHLSAIADGSGKIAKRQAIPGYALLNMSLRYDMGKKTSAFINVTNALDQRFKNVGFNMDLTNTNTDVFHGQRQDPIRINGGLNITL